MVSDAINLAVVDDLRQDQERLRAALQDYAVQRGLRWKVDCYPSGEAFLRAFEPGRYAAVFLDVLMPGLNGIETARQVRAQDQDVFLIFVTTEADYAVEGYEVEAAGFSVKEESRHLRRFDRLMERLQTRLKQDAALDFTSYGVPFCVLSEAMLYAEVLDHDMTLHTRSGVRTLRMTLEELKQMLPADGRFFECHRGVVINLDAVTALRGNCVVMENGDTLPVSRRRRPALEGAYAARSVARVRGGI